jgi:hypothetical protein
VLDSWTTAFVLPFVAVAVVWWGRRHGASWPTVGARLLLAASLLAIASQAILPISLRADSWGFDRVDGVPTIVPFVTIRAYLSHGLVDVEIRQLLGNVALFVPFGLTLPLAVGRCRRAWWTIGAGAALSIVVEVLQMILPSHGPDVDDVILNTLGAAVGYIGYRVIRSVARIVVRSDRPVGDLP